MPTTIPNPYTTQPLHPVSNMALHGRRQLIREIEEIVLSAPHQSLMVHGPSKMGKTSLMNWLHRICSAQIVPIVIRLENLNLSSSLVELAQYLVNAVQQSAQYDHGLILPVLKQEDLHQDPFPAIRGWLGQIAKEMPGKKLLLCIDDFERLDSIVESTGNRAPLNFLRYFVQSQRQWSLLVAGSTHPHYLADHWHDCLIGVQTLRLEPLDDIAARNVMTNPIPGFPALFDEGAIGVATYITGGHPYLLQLLSRAAVNMMELEPRHKEDPLTALTLNIPEVLGQASNLFHQTMAKLPENERAALLRVVAKASLEGAELELAILTNREQILKPDGTFRIPLFQKYLEHLISPALGS